MTEYLKREDVRRAVLHNEGDAVIAAIDELPVTEMSDWIPVTERLPKRPYEGYAKNHSDIVIAYTTKTEVVPARLFEDAKTVYWRTTEDGRIEVTHWMPLPQPPEGKQ